MLKKQISEIATQWNFQPGSGHTLWKFYYFLSYPMEFHVIMCQPYGISTLLSHNLEITLSSTHNTKFFWKRPIPLKLSYTDK